jgi:hypothetical protein
MYVDTLHIRNLRSFEFVELALRHPDEAPLPERSGVPHLPNVTLLLGNNGAGKTTVLRAVALSTLGFVLSSGSGFVPYSLVRRVEGRKPRDATVFADVVLDKMDGVEPGKDNVEVKLGATSGFTDRFISAGPPAAFPASPWDEPFYEESSPGFFVLGYGSTRRVEPGGMGMELRFKERVLRYSRVASLFEEHVALIPLLAWLPRWKQRHPEHQRQAVALMNRLLPDAELLAEPQEGEYLFRRGGAVLPYAALSDGYRAFISWVGDMLYHLCLACPSGKRLVDLRGVVLVDEVDLHMHPEWQRHVVPTLSQVLPNLQFVLTSHSPLVVGTLSHRNILLMKEHTLPTGERVTRVEVPDEELYGLSADQILTSESFGLESSRDERFFERLKDAAAQAREGSVEQALRFMRMMGGGAAAEPAPVPPEAKGPTAKKPRRPSKKKLAVKRSTKTSAKVSTGAAAKRTAARKASSRRRRQERPR